MVFDEVRLTYFCNNAWRIRFRWCSEFMVRVEVHPRGGGRVELGLSAASQDPG